MRNKLLCLLIGLSLISIPLLAQDDAYSNYERRSVTSRIARISYIEGDAKLNTQFVQINTRILEGDELYTQEGRVEVYLNGDFLRLNHHTKVVFAGLGEESTLVDVRYGEVYIQSERTIDIQTPHENFSLQGVYRIEVDRYDTKKLRNPMYDDDFDKWSYWREREAGREIYYAEEYEEEEEPYSRRANTYVGGIGWDPWYPYSYWNDLYYGWHSYWRWTSWYYGWHPYWSWTNWYWNSYYPYYSNYYYRSNYYYGSSYGYYRPNQRYIVRKDQLKRRTPVNQGVKRIGSKTGTATTATKGKQLTRISKSKGIKSTPSGGTARRTVPTKSRTIKKKKISSSRLGSIGRIYPSRIQTRIKTSIKKNKSSTYSRSLNTGSSYRSPKISSRTYTRRSYSKPSTSRSYLKPSTSRSYSRPSTSRSYSGSSARSSSGSSRSGSSGKVRKK